jgi:rubrerythrin
MTAAIINRVNTSAADSNIPKSYYTCQKCGYRNITLSYNYCPTCGKAIDKFYATVLRR